MFGSLRLSEKIQSLLDKTWPKTTKYGRVADVLAQMGYENIEKEPRDSNLRLENYAYDPSTNTHFVVVEPALM